MKKFLSVVLALAMLQMLYACGSEPSVIGAWQTETSILGYAEQTGEPYEITINLGYENQGQEFHAVPDSSRNLPFNYTYEDNMLTVWQGSNTVTFRATLTEDSMTLTCEDGSSIPLTRISDTPLGVQ